MRIIALIKKEFAVIWRDPKSRLLIIMPPLMQLLIFAHAVTMEVKNIDMVVWDQCQTEQSRELINKFHCSKWFRSIILVDTSDSLKKEINAQRVQLGLIIPNDFSKKIVKKQQTNLQIIVDGRQTNSAAIAGNYAVQIISDYQNELFPTRFNSQPEINLEVRNWYNPNLTFLWYTVISLLTILALAITLMLTALSIARERELGTFDQLVVSPLSAFEILVGKTVPPLCISVCLVIFMTTIAITCFHIHFAGSFLIFLVSTVIALLAIVGVGLFISSICTTQQQAILGCFTFQTPAVIMSGFISPIEDMPVFCQYLTYGNPTRFFLAITKGVFFKNMPFHQVFANLIPLMIIAIISLSLAGWMFKRKLD
jgi:ABC-2 type transport system permease protein